jgi:hypothetical protein
MKRLVLVLGLVVLLVPATAMAQRPYSCWIGNFTGNVSSTELPLKNYLMSYSILASADDAVTLTITDAVGNTAFTITTSSATSGESGKFTGYPLMSSDFDYVISDFAGGGTLQIEICGANQ